MSKPKKDLNATGAADGSLKPTRKTAKLIAVLALLSDQTIAEYMTETLDPILEERFAKMQASGTNRLKRE